MYTDQFSNFSATTCKVAAELNTVWDALRHRIDYDSRHALGFD